MIHVLSRLGRPAALAALLAAVPTVIFAQNPPPQAPAGAPMGGRMMMRTPWMMRLDATKPISFAQYQTAALAWFDEADTNHDGMLTPDERRAWIAAHMPGGANMGGDHRRFAGANGANPNAQSLTRADFQGRLQQQFDAIDTDHDGTITPDEMQAAAERRSHYRQLQ